MSYFEYNDLFLNGQKTGQYQVFTFDIENSSLMNKEELNININNNNLITKNIYNYLKELEIKKNIKILLDEKELNNCIGEVEKKDPFFFSDMSGFTIYRDSINEDLINELYKYFSQKIYPNIKNHLASGFYETNDYNEANTKYYRGYCIQLLSNLHKDDNLDIKKKIK